VGRKPERVDGITIYKDIKLQMVGGITEGLIEGVKKGLEVLTKQLDPRPSFDFKADL